MVADFIRNLFGRPVALSPPVEEALGELARLGRERPSLAQSAALFSAILRRLYAPIAPETPPGFSGAAAAAMLKRSLPKTAAGVPILRGELVMLDPNDFSRRWFDVCAAVHEHQGGEEAQKLATALQRGGLTQREMIVEVLAGRPESVAAQADALGLDAGLTATVLRLTLLPALAQIDAALAPLRAGVSWERGYCPTCGSWPLLGEFRGLEQTRFLRCGLCAAGWEFSRLLCPFCDGSDHRALGYLSVEGEETWYRAATCDACHGYVKMVSTLAPLSAPQLLVADLATMHLDLAAAERGFGVTR